MKNNNIIRLASVFGLPLLLALALVWTFVSSVKAGRASEPAAEERGLSYQTPGLAGVDVDLSGAVILSQDDRSLVIQFEAPDYRVEAVESEAGTCQVFYIEDFGNLSDPGSPRLPTSGAWIGIPPEGEVSLEILEASPVELEGSFNLCPAPEPIVAEDMTAGEPIQGYRSVPDPSIYDQSRFFPEQPVLLASDGFMRSQRIAALRFSPLQYNPVGGKISFTQRIVLRVSLPVPSRAAEARRQAVDEGEFEAVLRATLLNYEAARSWRTPPGLSGAEGLRRDLQGSSLLQAASGTAAKILVNKDGIYQLTYADLLAAGVPVSGIDPRTFRLENQGSQVAIEIPGEADGVFDTTDTILFYGLAPTTKWAVDNVYWLTWGEVDVLRIQTEDGTPSSGYPAPTYFMDTQRFEQNPLYRPAQASGPEKERWMWLGMAGFKSGSTPIPDSEVQSFNLADPVSESVSATLRIRLHGTVGFPQHHTVISINNKLVADLFWPDTGSFETAVNFPQSYLVNGSNQITFYIPVDGNIIYDYLYVNWFEITYARQHRAVQDSLLIRSQPGNWEIQAGGFSNGSIDLLDISTPTLPVRISALITQPLPGTYQASFDHARPGNSRVLVQTEAKRLAPKAISLDQPSDLHNPANGADYIIISHASFMSAIQPLANHRAGQGLRTAVVDVQDVYDEFSAGLMDPKAIHDFLAFAYANWQPPAPLYVLLVGDGNYDFKNYLGFNAVNYIPAYLEDVDKYILETSSDNRFVTFVGDDFLPDMNVGRLTVRTTAQVTNMVNKILAYEQQPVGDWGTKVTFVADRKDVGAGDFPLLSDFIADNDLPAYYWEEKLYYNGVTNTISGVRSQIIASINDGRLLVSYVGHGARAQWGSGLLNSDNIASLNNTGKYPFFVPMTCWEGYYIEPNASLSAFAEVFLRAENRGPIASFSPTGLGLASGHDHLERGLFRAIFRDYVSELGQATTQAKLYMMSVTGNGFQDLVDTFVLLGDPATRMPILKVPDLAISKTGKDLGIVSEENLVQFNLDFTNTANTTATQVLISDTLPAVLQDVVLTSSGLTVTQLSSSPLLLEIADIGPGQSGRITITASLADGFAGAIANAASISSLEELPLSLADNRSETLLSIRPTDLVIRKDGTLDGYVAPDYWITYHLVYTNTGYATAPGVTISDTLPAGLQDVQVITSGIALTQTSSQPLNFQLADIPAGAGGQITITARFPADQSTLLLENSVEISSLSEPVEFLGDNRAYAAISLPRPDLKITKTGSLKGLAYPDTRASYQIAFTNQGELTASQVIISDTLPAALFDVVVTTSGVPMTQTLLSPLQIEVADLGVGQSGLITVTGTLTEGFYGPLSNSVEITSLEETLATQSDNRALSLLEVFAHYFLPIVGNP